MAEDQTIDNALRDVPVPAGIDGRMSLPALFTDATIDRLLADVAAPAGLAERLRAALVEPPAGGGVVDLDRIGLQPCPARVRPASGRARRWLAALARDGGLVALSLCGVAGLFVGGMELSRRLERGGDVAVTVPPPPETLAAASSTAPAAPVSAPSLPPVAERSVAAPRRQPHDTPTQGTGSGQASMTRPAGSVVAIDAPSPTVRGAPLAPAAGVAEPATAGMRFVDPPAWTRRGVPRVRGYDLAFEIAHGEAPFVDPALDPALTIDRPPLSLRTDTFDAFRLTPDRRAAASGRPLRVEHVLAALPGAAVSPAASAATPRLDMHVVRSLRKVAGVQTLLVEARVTAPPLDRDARTESGVASAGDPIDATIVLDRSVGGAGLAWPWTCRALAATAAQMGPRDRLTVVIAGPVPQLVLRRRGATEVAALAAALERLSAAGFSDLDAALRMARTAANSGSRLVVVAQAGSLQRGGGDTQAAVAAWRQAIGDGNGERGEAAPARFVILDATVAEGSDADTSSTGGTAANPVALRRAVLRQVFGVPTLVARQCNLAVSFPPRQVAAYRIIGHRQSVVDSLSPEPSAAVDLHAGETVRVVYEILPRAAGSGAAAAGKDLATATLTWRSPADAAAQEARAVVAGGGPDVTAALPSAHGCELLLAVGLGDIAGESAHVGRRGTTAAALAAVANRWQARGDVTPFGTVLVGCLERWASDLGGTR